jgi:hypothetical protein
MKNLLRIKFKAHCSQAGLALPSHITSPLKPRAMPACAPKRRGAGKGKKMMVSAAQLLGAKRKPQKRPIGRAFQRLSARIAFKWKSLNG